MCKTKLQKKLCNVHDHRTHILITENELGRQHESISTHLQLYASKHQVLTPISTKTVSSQS